jgi:hypothetical protein
MDSILGTAIGLEAAVKESDRRQQNRRCTPVAGLEEPI